MNVSVVNLGCKVNRVESDTIAASYVQRGCNLTLTDDADIVVINTCTVTEEAEKKTRKAVRRVLRQNAHAQVIVTGCAASVDPEFYQALDDRVRVIDKFELTNQEGHGPSSIIRVGDQFPTRVAVKIQDGCNHACSYCIVHVARGRAWSRPVSEVREEVIQLARHNVKEIILSGIDLGSYSYRGDGAAGHVLLPDLVRLLLSNLDQEGFYDTRLRISSIEPRSLKSSFIDLLAHSEGRICRHLHLPLQSGSTKVLRDMNRPYTAQEYLALVEQLKQVVGRISLTTDIIVGFPGETDADFQRSVELAKEVGFTKIHVFRYSKRTGTPAAMRTDQIDSATKEKRAHVLLNLSEELRNRYIEMHGHKTETCVVEQQGWAMSESYYKVKVDDALEPRSIVCTSLQDCCCV